MKEVGSIEHYFSKIGVAVVKVSGSIKVGDTLYFKGENVDFAQKVASMQVDHAEIPEAKKGDDIGMKVDHKVHEHVKVFKE
jgi:translation elongation factor EF-1alpha